MSTLPDCETLLLKLEQGVLHISFNRPQARNAMSVRLVAELSSVLDAVAEERGVRAIVLRGVDGNFCAGGDIKDMAALRQAPTADNPDPAAAYNRGFGHLLNKVNAAPQAVIAILEGAVLGGGFGLACVSDVAIAKADAKFGLPETGLGLPPAQIAPFVVARVGLTQARRLGVCGGRFDGHEALRLGMVHFVCETQEQIDAQLAEVVGQVRRCAPQANAVTKQLMLRVGQEPLEPLLDWAATQFSAAVRGPEGMEGTMAFVQKRRPNWAE